MLIIHYLNKLKNQTISLKMKNKTRFDYQFSMVQKLVSLNQRFFIHSYNKINTWPLIRDNVKYGPNYIYGR